MPPLNPLAKQWLDLISFSEGTYSAKPGSGYDIKFGGGRFQNLQAHPGGTVAGRYQFQPGTWKVIANRLGLRDFGPSSQDTAALELIKGRGVNPFKDPINPNTLAKLAPEWASLPTLRGVSYYGQPAKTFNQIRQFLGRRSAADVEQPPASSDIASEPTTLPRVDFKQVMDRVAQDFLTKSILQPQETASSQVNQYLDVASRLETSTNPEEQQAAEEYFAEALRLKNAQPSGLDLTALAQNAAQAQQATEAYNAKQTAIESVLNAQQTIPISNLSAPETGPALAYKGAVVTSAKDTSGEPGFDFVIPGGRGAVFKAPFNAQVLKVVGDQNWETHLEQGSGQRGYGNYVDIRAKTPEGRAFDVRLAHFDAINPALKPGMVIGPGTAIGKQGRTGSTTGPHVSWDMYDPNKNTTSPDLLRLRDQFAARISRGQPIL